MSDQFKELTEHVHEMNRIVTIMSPGETDDQSIMINQTQNTLSELQDNIINLKDAFEA